MAEPTAIVAEPTAVVAVPGAVVAEPGAVGGETARAATEGAAALVEPGARGRLRIADRVAQRIAVAAARDVDGVAVTTAGALSPLGRSYPHVEVEVAGDRVRARVEVAGRWPVPAARLAADVRAAVSERLRMLAGLRVDAVDVTVATMTRGDLNTGRRVR